MEVLNVKEWLCLRPKPHFKIGDLVVDVVMNLVVDVIMNADIILTVVDVIFDGDDEIYVYLCKNSKITLYVDEDNLRYSDLNWYKID